MSTDWDAAHRRLAGRAGAARPGRGHDLGVAGRGRGRGRGVPLGAAGVVPQRRDRRAPRRRPHGPQRLVPLEAVVERAGQSARIRRRSEREVGLEAQVALLRSRVDQLEIRLAALEGR